MLDCREKTGVMIRHTRGREKHMVKVQGTVVLAIYDRANDHLVTFLPRPGE